MLSPSVVDAFAEYVLTHPGTDLRTFIHSFCRQVDASARIDELERIGIRGTDVWSRDNHGKRVMAKDRIGELEGIVNQPTRRVA